MIIMSRLATGISQELRGFEGVVQVGLQDDVLYRRFFADQLYHGLGKTCIELRIGEKFLIPIKIPAHIKRQ